MVNVVFSGLEGAGDRNWVLIDAGLPGFAGSITRGRGQAVRPGGQALGDPPDPRPLRPRRRPEGAGRGVGRAGLRPREGAALSDRHVPLRPARPDRRRRDDGGLAWMYPRGPIDLGGRVHRLARGRLGAVHARLAMGPHAGPHRRATSRSSATCDATLIAGDAFVATKQESALAILEQRQEIHGPPAYFTPDWVAARRSVEELAKLEPTLAITGHGLPLEGRELKAGLHRSGQGTSTSWPSPTTADTPGTRPSPTTPASSPSRPRSPACPPAWPSAWGSGRSPGWRSAR